MFLFSGKVSYDSIKELKIKQVSRKQYNTSKKIKKSLIIEEWDFLSVQVIILVNWPKSCTAPSLSLFVDNMNLLPQWYFKSQIMEVW